MFEQDINRIKQKVTLYFDLSKEYYNLTDILQMENLDKEYRKYFESEVYFWICKEIQALINSKYFDLKRNEYYVFFENFKSLLFKSSRIFSNDIREIIDVSVKSFFNFLIRPRTTLRVFVFDNQEHKTQREIILKLNYFSHYEPLTNSIIKEIKLKFPDENIKISYSDFNKILIKADNDYFKNINQNDLDSFFLPIFQLFSGLIDNKEVLIAPIIPFIIFFDDKSYNEISSKLESLLNEGEDSISSNKLIDIIISNFHSIKELPEEISEIESHKPLPKISHTLDNVTDSGNFQKEYTVISTDKPKSKEEVKKRLISLFNSLASDTAIQTEPDSITNDFLNVENQYQETSIKENKDFAINIEVEKLKDYTDSDDKKKLKNKLIEMLSEIK